MHHTVAGFFNIRRLMASWLAAMLFLASGAAQGVEPETVRTGDIPVVQAPKAASEIVPAHATKRKIAIAQFDVADTQHVDDINNIYDGLPTVLASRLDASGEFIASYDGRSVPAEAGAAQSDAIIQIAGKTGAQFLITGLVVNAGSSKEKGYLGTSLGGYKKRFLEIELSVYDGLTGARLMQHRFREQAQGEVMVGNHKPFGSSIFFETEFGQALNRLLDFAVKDIRSALKKVPFSTHIIRVEGKTVFLDAGSDSLLKPGDKLVAYVRDTRTPITGLNGAVLGAMERGVDTIALTKIQPQFSIGELSEVSTIHGIKAGNVARINIAEERDLTAKQIAAQQLLKAQQEAAEEAERKKIAQAAQDAEEKAKAERAAIEKIEEAKKAKAQAVLDAKAAKVKARQEAIARRNNAAQEARAREQAQAIARAAARAKAAELKKAQAAEAARIKSEKIAKAKADAEMLAAEQKARREVMAEAARIKAAERKAMQEALAEAALVKAAELKARQQTLAEAARVKSEEQRARQEARAEAARIDADERASSNAGVTAEHKVRREAKPQAQTDELMDEQDIRSDDVLVPVTEEQAALAEAEEDAWLASEYKAAAVVRAAELKARKRATARRIKARQAAVEAIREPAEIKAGQAVPDTMKAVETPARPEGK